MTAIHYEDMMDSYPDTAVIFGDSAMTHFEAHLLLNGNASALFFLGGSGSADRSGAWQAALKATSNVDMELSRHMDIPPEPDTACVEAMVASIEKAKPDIVIAIGGGSVMDAAKAAYISWQTGLPLSELFGAGRISARFPDRQFKRIVCIPTTAGTGSEVTPYSNIVDRALGVKMLIADQAIIPEYAFVNPQFTMSAPRALTLHVALDALAHSVEGFLNIKAKSFHKDADKWALESIRLIVGNLGKALEHPHDGVAREALSAAATLGGMVIRNKPTSLPHLCSFSFFDKIPHGLVVASLLPHFWRFYLEEPAMRERTMLLKGVFPGTAQDTPEEIIDAFAAFIVSCGAPKSLGGLPGCDKAFIAKIASDARRNAQKLETAPRPVPLAESERILSGVLQKAFKA